MNKKLTLWTVVGVIVAGAAGTLLFTSSANLNTYDHLTACLRDNGSVMFGASWCPHCADQKKLFERGTKNIPYFECSPDGAQNPQHEECAKRLIQSYPVWQFDEGHLASLPDDVWQVYGQLYDNYVTDGLIPEEEALSEDASHYHKLSALPGPGPGTSYINQGRIPGLRTLDELALYGNCEEALAKDRNQG